MQEDFLKLANAVYKLVEFFPESDPLKNRAKDRALSLMENFTLFSEFEKNNADAEKIKMQIFEDVDMLLGYLWLAKCQGWTSDTNYLIISNECKKARRCVDFGKTEAESIEIVKKPEPMVLGQVTPRQGKILDFLASNEKAQVVDLQKVLGSVTKRTIRRDLDQLLRTGKVVRLGEFNEVFYKINKVGSC